MHKILFRFGVDFSGKVYARRFNGTDSKEKDLANASPIPGNAPVIAPGKNFSPVKPLRFGILAASLSVLSVSVGCRSRDTVTANTLDPALMATAKGEVVYCPLPLLASVIEQMDQPLIDAFNAQNNGVHITVKPFSYTGDMDDAYDKSLDAKDCSCDIITPFYAIYKLSGKEQILDFSPYVATRNGEFFSSIINSVSLNKKVLAIPIRADAMMFYYRPAIFENTGQFSTWQNLYTNAASHSNFVYNAGGVGLTANVISLLYQAGGELISEDGKTSKFQSPQAHAVLNFLVSGVQSQVIPSQALTFTNNVGASSFFAKTPSIGGLTDWSASKFRIDTEVPSTQNSYKIVPLPAWAGREGQDPTGLIGSNFLSINAYSKNPNAALKVIDYLSSAAAARHRALSAGTGPAIKSVYDDPAVREKIPYLDILYNSLLHGRARPNTSAYTEIDTVISTYAAQALAGTLTVDQAVDQIDKGITKAIQKYNH